MKTSKKQFFNTWDSHLKDLPVKVLDFTDSQFVELIMSFADQCRNLECNYSFLDGLFVGDFIANLQYFYRCIKSIFHLINIDDTVCYLVKLNDLSPYTRKIFADNVEVLKKYTTIKNLLYKTIEQCDLSTIHAYFVGNCEVRRSTIDENNYFVNFNESVECISN